MRRFLLVFFLGVLAGLWEISVRPFLPPWWMFKPLLALVVLLLVGSSRAKALTAAIGGSLVLDLYAVTTFDIAIVRWILLVFFLDLLLRHVLTNRSLYVSAALIILGRLFERGSAWFFGSVSHWLGLSPYGWVEDTVWWVPFVWDVIFVSLGFFILAFMTKRFSPALSREEVTHKWL